MSLIEGAATVDAIRYRAPEWRAIWNDEPGVHGACDDLDALLVHYDALKANHGLAMAWAERLCDALVYGYESASIRIEIAHRVRQELNL